MLRGLQRGDGEEPARPGAGEAALRTAHSTWEAPRDEGESGRSFVFRHVDAGCPVRPGGRLRDPILARVRLASPALGGTCHLMGALAGGGVLMLLRMCRT